MYGKTYQVGIRLPTRMRNVLGLEEDKVEGGRASEVETKKESKMMFLRETDRSSSDMCKEYRRRN
jgi:hypothetical protein